MATSANLEHVRRVRDAIRLSKENQLAAVEESYPGLYLWYKRTLESLVEYPADEHSNSCGVWIYGPPRCGKDYAVRECGSVYVKLLNKWWDGYKEEENVLLSDVEPDHMKWLAHFLKIWMDRCPYIAEVKGGSLKIRPKKIFVTSNYSLEECVGGVLLEALKARCKIYDCTALVPRFVARQDSTVQVRVLRALQTYEFGSEDRQARREVRTQSEEDFH